MGLGKIGAKGCMKASKASGPGPMSPITYDHIGGFLLLDEEEGESYNITEGC